MLYSLVNSRHATGLPGSFLEGLMVNRQTLSTALLQLCPESCVLTFSLQPLRQLTLLRPPHVPSHCLGLCHRGCAQTRANAGVARGLSDHRNPAHDILQLIQEYAGSAPVTLDATLSTVGIDSISSMDLMRCLQEGSAETLPSALLLDHPTVRELSRAFGHTCGPRPCPALHQSKVLMPSILAGYESVGIWLTCVQHGTSQDLTFIVPSAIGHVPMVHESMLGSASVFAFEHCFIATGDVHTLELTLFELASAYASALSNEAGRVERTSAAKSVVWGASFGGCLAHLVARHARTCCGIMSQLVLIDPTPPLRCHFSVEGYFGTTLQDSARQYIMTVAPSSHGDIDLRQTQDEELGILVANHMSIAMGVCLELNVLIRTARVLRVIHRTNHEWDSALGTRLPRHDSVLLLLLSSDRKVFFGRDMGYADEDTTAAVLHDYGVPAELLTAQGGHVQVVRDFFTGRILQEKIRHSLHLTNQSRPKP